MKFIIEIILWIVAIGLIIPLTLINFILVWICYGNPKGYFLSTAISLDRWGNREYRTLWNSMLITTNSVNLFGNPNETISSVLGKNKLAETLSVTGKCLATVLDFFDENHCVKSIIN